MTKLPRVVIAAPASGHGKTTVATGLMAALAARGLEVSGHKVGPDYIDPGYHSLATGRPGRNLDPYLVGSQRIVPLLRHGAAGADIAVIEGVMGLFDGRLGAAGEASTAHVATLTASPVILVVDVSHASRTHAAVVAGLAGFDPEVRICGVILNKCRTDRHADEVQEGLMRTGIPILGRIPREAGVETPSRHLGLIPAAERAESVTTLARMAAMIESHVDLDAILEIARSATLLTDPAWDPTNEVSPPSPDRPIVAVAGGRAFTFRYAETDDLLLAAGCTVVEFDPLTDSSLPAGTAGIYLGGGFPEMHVADLAANTSLLDDLRSAVAAGVPTVAECAGFAYLCRTLDAAPAVGVISAAAAMTPRLALGYRTAVASADNLLARTGERVRGHEFHRTRVTPDSPEPGSECTAAWTLPTGPDGYAHSTLHASYLHVHWAGHPSLAQRFADAVHRYARQPDPLSHHGDAETGPGLLDFAVNVYAEPRPDWLNAELHHAVDGATSYPDVTAARSALAARHSRPIEDVLPTAGGSEAFALVAALRQWRRPVIVHPQFTGPHAALTNAGHHVTTVLCHADDGFALHPEDIPEDADLVVIGNPTNPTGVLHPAATILQLLRPGRVVLVDEAFLDAVPGEPESLSSQRHSGLLVIRSLTKHWSIPGIRAGYLLGDPALVAQAAQRQVHWSVSTPAVAAMIACSDQRARTESEHRARKLRDWRTLLVEELGRRNIAVVDGCAPFVLARLGCGVRDALRSRGIAVRRADTFPGLGHNWARIAVREETLTAQLLAALDQISDRVQVSEWGPRGADVTTCTRPIGDTGRSR
ncbi:cobyrinate a,c-diamide synthase [Mycolicibacterium goodii]|uniref:cobyrinate a,c-diamide synthase n=1 Tax=Mycolicibacterium goodii TaxID=134601 RepID=UPI003990620F